MVEVAYDGHKFLEFLSESLALIVFGLKPIDEGRPDDATRDADDAANDNRPQGVHAATLQQKRAPAEADAPSS
jgi:hypothetical protein